MVTYQYTAKDNQGRNISGTLEANSETEAAGILHTKELIVLFLKPAEAKSKKSADSKDKKVKLDDLVIFSRQLATMIDAGIPLVQVLNILGEQIENKALRAVVVNIREDIEAGTSFCDALAKHPTVFSDLFVNMSRAGEASGTLDDVLDRLATYFEKTAALTRKIRSSLVYPAVVITMAIAITAFLLIKVVPTFESIFESLKGQLPLPTQILISVSKALRKYFIYLVGAIVGCVFAIKAYINTPKGRYNFDSWMLKVPVFGVLFTKVAIAKFSRTFSTLIKSGVSILSALEIVAKTSGNKVVETTIMNSRTSIREGEPLSVPLQKSKVFPPMVTRMIGVGEQTGKLESMLSKIADFYDDQVDAAVSGMTSMIEPLVIAVLGVVIGGIVVSLFMPIFKITELINK